MIGLLKTPSSKRKFLVFIGDAVIMAATVPLLIFLHAFLVKYGVLKHIVRPLKPYALYISPVVHVLMSYIFEMYDIRRGEKLRTLVSMLTISFLSFCFMFSLAKVLRINQTTMVYIFVFFIACALLLYYWRLICRRVLLILRKFIKEKVLFIGTDSITKEILDEMKHRDYKVVGLLTDDGSGLGKNKSGLRVVGTWKDLHRIISARKVNIIVTALDINLPLSIMKGIYKCRFSGIEVYDSTYFYEILARKVVIKHYLENDRIPYLNVDAFVRPFFRKVKRLIDFCSALFALILLSPLFLISMVLIKLTSNGPIFFLQERLGFQETTFKLIKLRTMVADAEKENGPQWSNKNDSRVTKLGRLLRKTRLDELPQLINICKGNMSFIGPRPIRQHFADIIEEHMPFYSLRFTIKPGLTGWAQVHYDYGGTIEGHMEKFQYDLYYIKHASVFLDLFILVKTLQTIVRRPAY